MAVVMSNWLKGIKLDGPNDLKWTIYYENGRSKVEVGGRNNWMVIESGRS